MSMTLANESVVKLLQMRPVEISVGAPWDFESEAGPNRLEGTILSIEIDVPDSPAGNGQSVNLEVTSFASKAGKTVTHIRATARYTEDRESFIEKLANGARVPANLSYSEQAPEEQMPEGSSPFLIGSLSLAIR